MKRVIDISWPISKATTGYKDKNTVEFNDVKTFAKDNARETVITVSSHTGTHVDAPAHFLKDGKTIDQIKLDRIVGSAVVLDMTHVADAVTRRDLEPHEKDIVQGGIVLLKTANSSTSPTDKFSPHFIYLEYTGAEYCKERQVKAVGIDYLGIERSQQGHPTHTILMHANIVVIEGLRLGHVDAGHYELVCLPLYTIGLEAAPARAILMQEDK